MIFTDGLRHQFAEMNSDFFSFINYFNGQNGLLFFIRETKRKMEALACVQSEYARKNRAHRFGRKISCQISALLSSTKRRENSSAVRGCDKYKPALRRSGRA